MKRFLTVLIVTILFAGAGVAQAEEIASPTSPTSPSYQKTQQCDKLQYTPTSHINVQERIPVEKLVRVLINVHTAMGKTRLEATNLVIEHLEKIVKKIHQKNYD